MSESPLKLSYNHKVLEKVRRGYEGYSREQLLEILCQLTKDYIIDGTMPYNIPIPEKDEPLPPEKLPDAQNGDSEEQREAPTEVFARLVMQMKKRTGLPQFENFDLDETGRAILVIDNQKVTFGERTTVEFVPFKRRPTPDLDGATPVTGPAGPSGPTSGSAPVPQAPAPRPPVASPPSAPGRAAPPAANPAPKAPDPRDMADVDHIVERFRRLDLD